MYPYLLLLKIRVICEICLAVAFSEGGSVVSLLRKEIQDGSGFQLFFSNAEILRGLFQAID